MTRFKEELRKRGYQLECDCEMLPDYRGSLTLDTIRAYIDGNKIIYKRYYTSITLVSIFDSKWNETQDFEE